MTSSAERNSETKPGIPSLGEIGFFGHQQLIALKNRGRIDPLSLDDYLAADGYTALGKVLTEMSAEAVIGQVKESKLRGRGGAGFPVGLKWEFTRKADGAIKYVVCNADEGNPGAFMDRSILESDPHCVLEGMIIGAYAIGAREGYLYIRDEYPTAISTIQNAIEQCREIGLLGSDILGSGFDFDLFVARGAGAFVCGEETALLASIEGKDGVPRLRPPFPAEKGLWDSPTAINNVKSWAFISHIINRGGDWFAGIGTATSTGTKVLSLNGNLKYTGLIEVPMGTTLRTIVEDIGGGFRNGRSFKAVQLGGPAGGFLPESELDLPLDYDVLAEAGTGIGSGGVIIMDDSACVVDTVWHFMEFSTEESCGKCTPCREGCVQAERILRRICTGGGRTGDLERLERLARGIKINSFCGLGQTAVNPILSGLTHFRDEFTEHIMGKTCPAGVCGMSSGGQP